MREAADRGILVVMAAGNQGLDHPGNLSMAEAAYPRSVLVGALDASGQVWSGTNRPGAAQGRYEYAWQNGVKVPTVNAAGNAAWATGTSFAAPFETAKRLTWAGRPEATAGGSRTVALR